MQQVADFVDFMDKEGYLDDTVVVIMGDHQRQTGRLDAFYEELGEKPDRTLYNRIWVPHGVEFPITDIDQLSMYPTLLELLGIGLTDGRAGVGVSALEADPKSRTIRDLSPKAYRELIEAHSTSFFVRMWADQSGPIHEDALLGNNPSLVKG